MLKAIKAMLGSRKWLVAAGAFVVSCGVILAGWDEQTATEIVDKVVNVALVLSGLFIGTTAIEDAAAKLNKKPD